MRLTEHARLRLRQRFPGMEGVTLLEQWEMAQGRRPTPEQLRRILASMNRRHAGRKLLVSPRGIVFVVVEEDQEPDVVVTVFTVPRGRPKRLPSLTHRQRLLEKAAAGQARRLRERDHLRELEGE